MASSFPTQADLPASDGLGPAGALVTVGMQHVLHCLEGLPDDWYVAVRPRLGLDRPDVVVAHREHGVMAIEVFDHDLDDLRQRPDGQIEIRDGERWRPLSVLPRYRAHRARVAVSKALRLNGHSRSYRDVAGMVVVPSASTEEARRFFSTGECDRAETHVSVWGGDELATDPQRVLIGARILLGYDRPPMDMPALAAAVMPTRTRDPRPFVLSRDAAEIEANPSGARIRVVRGAAGCGKSTALASRAAWLSARGYEVLVLVESAALVPRLASLAARRCGGDGGVVDRICIVPLSELADRVLDDARLAGLSIVPEDARDDVERARLVSLAYRGGVGPTFDAVLVDEGHDVGAHWWRVLRSRVCRPSGELMVMVDPIQAGPCCDGPDWVGPGDATSTVDLAGAYRMPPDITAAVAAFATEHLSSSAFPAVPADHPARGDRGPTTTRRWVDVAGDRDAADVLAAEVVALLDSHPGLAPRDVTFLVSSVEEGRRVTAAIAARGVPVCDGFVGADNECTHAVVTKQRAVSGATFDAFKGWESRAVVMSVPSGPEARRRLYLGLTRVRATDGAGAFVTVVNGAEELVEFGRSFSSERSANGQSFASRW